MKAGYVAAYNRTDNLNHYNATRVNYRFLNGVPNQLTMQLGDFMIKDRSQYHGFYVQGSVDDQPHDAAPVEACVTIARSWPRCPKCC
jgi:hypothetical protein